MSGEYKKECYDIDKNIKIHYSHGVREASSTLGFLHYDEDLIIEFYRKGHSSVHIEGNIYNISEGDVLILNPDELHVTIRSDDCYMEKIVLHVNEGLLSQFGVERLVFFEKISKKEKGKGNLITSSAVSDFSIDENIENCLYLAKENSLENRVLLNCKTIELLSKLSKLIEKDEGEVVNTYTSNDRVNKIIDYINRHHTEEITLDSLSKHFHFSKYYISHLFKDYVGISPYDYLIARRLYCCNNLIRSNHTIKEASLMVGFNNYSNFYRLYKKYFKITPQQFKEQLKTEQ